MNPVIKFPVYNLKKEVLAPAGTELTDEFMLELCDRNHHHHESLPLLTHGKVRSDLLQQFQISPYNIIFSEEEIVDCVVQGMEHIRLPVPILDGIDYFRDNDFHTYRHMLIISALSILISQYLKSNYMKQPWKELVACGPTHDFGKISVPLSILLKKKILTRTELAMMKHHALAGYVLLSYYLKDHTCATAVIARDHHERRDGSGYPRGIHLNNLLAEVTTISDVYDALVAQRPYRPISYDNRTALEELTWMAKRGEIGWDGVRAMVAYNRINKPAPAEFEVSLEHRGTPPDHNLYGKTVDEQ